MYYDVKELVREMNSLSINNYGECNSRDQLKENLELAIADILSTIEDVMHQNIEGIIEDYEEMEAEK
ncbi:MAG: hypothetical protein KKH25_06020 [Candidatus Omnitrophica bacterium]|nr:hypothetical protein [Patescibacteria group bacterium]MBU2251797.1 hypothetical protein [Candidatus Omnitrophota bacterium]